MTWSRRFDEPIVTSDGRKLVTLAEAARCIMKLPKAERDSERWQTAGEFLIMVAEGRRPLMFAQIAMMQAVNHGKPATTIARRKRAKVYNIIS